MKRYLVFASDDYYPLCGAYDLQGSCNTLIKAVRLLENIPDNYENNIQIGNIFDVNTGEIVLNYYRGKWSSHSHEYSHLDANELFPDDWSGIRLSRFKWINGELVRVR